jgi:DNA-binding response OmpR family regulator
MKKPVSSLYSRYSPKVKKRILAIDDDEGIRDILKIIFEQAGFNIELKSDGNEVLQNKFTIPDLFLVDKQLSGTNGLDICRQLKSQDSTRNIPVIMISASPDIAKLSKLAGADDYIEKPFEISHLLKMIYRYTALDENDIHSEEPHHEMHEHKE